MCTKKSTANRFALKAIVLAAFVIGVAQCATTASDLPIAELPVDPDTGKVTYHEVVELPGISASEMYGSIQKWFAKTYKDSNEVIKVQDKETGTIIGRGAMQVTATFPESAALMFGFDEHQAYGYVSYSVEIEVKDGKYRFEFTDFTHEGRVKGTDVTMGSIEKWHTTRISPVVQNEIRTEVNVTILATIKDLHRYIVTQEGNDVW